MDYLIPGLEPEDFHGDTLLWGQFGCYDTIGDPYFDYDRDECLHNRSRYEFVRDRLEPSQQAELDQVDAYWRAHPKEFNEAFEPWHFRANKKTELKSFVTDANGNTPEIPRSHWWWWPIKIEE